MCEIITRFVPVKKAEFIRKQYGNIPEENRPLEITLYRNALIVPLGYVVDACHHPKENRLVEDLDLCADIVEAKDGDEVEDCRAMYCGYLHHDAWGHFITNTLARLWPIAKAGHRADKYVFLSQHDIDESNIRGNFAEIFRLLGIDGKIEILKRPKAYREVIAGDLSYNIDYRAYPEYVELINMIRKKALAGAGFIQSSKPIFLTRSALKNASKRDIGIGIIDNFYRDNGFEIAYPERLGVAELICKFEAAPIVCFVSGSGAHNSIFCPEGKEVHIIERTAICNIFQPVIEKAFSHKVVYIQASYSLLPVAYGAGPFLYAMTRWLKDYAMEYGFKLPTANSADASNFKTYLRLREKAYRYRWWIDSWADNQLDIFLEAYDEAKKGYSEHIGGEDATYVSPFKQFIKRMLKALKIR